MLMSCKESKADRTLYGLKLGERFMFFVLFFDNIIFEGNAKEEIYNVNERSMEGY